jgi:hypothetical protein
VRFLRVTLIGLGLLALACESDAEARAEAGKLAHAIEALRGADNQGKAPALAELRALPCSGEATCSVQSTCVAAYELHLRGLEGVAEGKRRASAGESGAADLPTLVASAQAALERAKDLSQKCADAQGELTRRYRLR